MRFGRCAPLVMAAALVALAACGVAPSVHDAASSSGSIHPTVDGNQLIDARSGAAWVPHGVNWPDLEYSCVQGWQPDHPASETQQMATWGIDVVRLPLNEDCWLGVDGAPVGITASAYRTEVAQRVAAIHAAGMVAILDLHWSAPTGSFADGQRSMPDAQSTTFWTQVATAYKNDPSVMFELFNEPYSRGNHSVNWSCWANGGCNVPIENDNESTSGTTYKAVGMKTLVAAVRGTGASQPILLGGLNYSNDLTGWLANAPADDQLVAAWHNYPGQGCSDTSCWDTTIVGVAAHVPVLMTEFGYEAGDSGQFQDTMTWADQHGMGYLPWAWWLTDPAYDDEAAQLYALVDGDDFHPKAPGGTQFHDHLATLSLPAPPTSVPSTSPPPSNDIDVINGPATAGAPAVRGGS
ncbi:MAG TPA: cellulase family glycosylhydrolase [Ilumatobacteraceae bacterium]